jgi:hypothetical protein
MFLPRDAWYFLLLAESTRLVLDWSTIYIGVFGIVALDCGGDHHMAGGTSGPRFQKP